MADHGFLVPPWYVDEPNNRIDKNTGSIFFGMTLGIAIFAFAKALRQTLRTWSKGSGITAYLYMLWAEWLASLTLAVVAWCFQQGFIGPRCV